MLFDLFKAFGWIENFHKFFSQGDLFNFMRAHFILSYSLISTLNGVFLNSI